MRDYFLYSGDIEYKGSLDLIGIVEENRVARMWHSSSALPEVIWMQPSK